MYNSKMYELGSKRSVIRELFEFGKKRAAEVGADKVYDFSLGNPNYHPSARIHLGAGRRGREEGRSGIYQRAFRNGAYRGFDIYDGRGSGGAHDMS